MKYSTPSIEVVNFTSSDAPRIGMQWYVGVGRSGWQIVDNPSAYNLSATLPTWQEIYTGTPGATNPVDLGIYGCSAVERLVCSAENIVLASGSIPRDLSNDNASLPVGSNLVFDNGQSC